MSNEEEILWQGSPSQWTNFWPFVLCVLVVPIPWAIWRWLATRSFVYEVTTQRIRIRDHQLRVIGAEMLSHPPRIGRFVVVGGGRTYRERSHRNARLLLGCRYHGRAVDAPGQKGPDGRVGDHAPPDRAAQ